jgi:site-specific recombinase XerD
VDAHGDHWLHVVGKGAKAGKVVLPAMARAALDRQLLERGLSVTPTRWDPATPLISSLEGEAGITTKRLRAVVTRFFATAAGVLAEVNPTLAEKLQRATPHWMRHTHATHALRRGAELTTVRDNLRHASLSTTSMYLHSDDLRRAKQMEGAFNAPAA